MLNNNIYKNIMDETFTEEYNIRHLKYAVYMGYKWIAHSIYKPTEEDHDGLTMNKKGMSPELYSKAVIRFAKEVIRKEGVHQFKLKWAEGRKEGRRYIDGWGYQSIQSDLKWFFAPEGYVDLDIVNCFPTLALYLCKENNISVPILTEYVENRQEVLNTHKITKRAVLRLMFQDNPKPKLAWLKRFASEFTEARDKLLDIYGKKHDLTNGKSKNNPKGSAINQLISIYEDEALCLVRQLIPHQQLTPFFDGIFCKEDGIDLERCNEITKKYGIKWSFKERSNDIVCPANWSETAGEDERMAIYRELCEKINPDPERPLIFKTAHPPSFWRYSPKNGEEFPYYQLTKQGLEHIYNCEGKIKNPFDLEQNHKQYFISIWQDDPNIPTYEKLDFVPYSKTGDTTPSNVFNTYIPYKYLSDPTDENDEISEKTKDWMDNYLFPLMSALMGETHEIGDKLGENAQWLWNLITHLVQYPERLPRVVLGLISRQGTGKDTIITFIQKLIGNNYVKRTSDPEEVFGTNNASLAGKLVVQINESGSYKAGALVNKMKALADCKGHDLADKYIKKFYVTNYVRQIFCSNETEGVKVECDNRRVNYRRCLNTFQGKKEFWVGFHQGMNDTEIIRDIFWIMMREDIEDYDPENFSLSKESIALMIKDVPTFPEWFKHQIEDNKLHDPFIKTRSKDKHEYFIGTTQLVELLRSYCNENGLKGEGFNKKSLGPKMCEMTSAKANTYRLDDGTRQRGYKFNSKEILDFINDQYYNKIPKECLITDDD